MGLGLLCCVKFYSFTHNLKIMMKELLTRRHEGSYPTICRFFNRYNEADFNLGLKKVEDQLSGPK